MSNSRLSRKKQSNAGSNIQNGRIKKNVCFLLIYSLYSDILLLVNLLHSIDKIMIVSSNIHVSEYLWCVVYIWFQVHGQQIDIIWASVSRRLSFSLHCVQTKSKTVLPKVWVKQRSWMIVTHKCLVAQPSTKTCTDLRFIAKRRSCFLCIALRHFQQLASRHDHSCVKG